MECENKDGNDVCPFDESMELGSFRNLLHSVLKDEFGEDGSGFLKLVLSVGDIEDSDIEPMKELSNSVFAHPGRLILVGLFPLLSSRFHSYLFMVSNW